jgi:dTDP-4-dehydrorhamnose 3,5-epimerase
MPFRFVRSEIPDVVIVEPRVFPDERGFFMETYKRSEFAVQGIDEIFVQGNHSKTAKGILRGLHYQKHPKAQGKLLRVLFGEIFDVAVDLRQDAPTFGKWVAFSLTSENRKMLYVPAGFAHGFCVLSDEAEVSYMTTVEYAPEHERGVRWDDCDLGIRWPIANPTLSSRDLSWPCLKDADINFRYDGTEAVGRPVARNGY